MTDSIPYPLKTFRVDTNRIERIIECLHAVVRYNLQVTISAIDADEIRLCLMELHKNRTAVSENDEPR